MARALFSRVLTVLGVMTLCLGATSSSCSLNGNDDGDGGDDPSFVTTLTLRGSGNTDATSFNREETITLVLTVRNRLSTAATIEFTDGRQDDYVVVRENSDRVLWQLSNGQTPPTGASQINFAAGETKTFTRTWNQLDNNGDLVRAGSYEARGALVYSNFDSSPLRSNQQGSTLVKFTIN